MAVYSIFNLMDKIEEKLWERVNKFLPLLLAVPFVKMIAVCNSLAFSTATFESDIDLFIIAKKNRVYTAHFFANSFLRLFGIRTYGEKKAGQFCLSFFIDESSLNLSKFAIKNDYYLAYWIYKLAPIADRGILGEFENKNKCILSILGKIGFKIDRSKIKKSVGSTVFRKLFEILLFKPIGCFFEMIFRKIEMKRIKNRVKIRKCVGDPSGIFVSDNIIKLHNEDRRLKYRDAYLKLIRNKGPVGFDEDLFISLLKDSHEK
jgi:hypothetical protein